MQRVNGYFSDDESTAIMQALISYRSEETDSIPFEYISDQQYFGVKPFSLLGMPIYAIDAGAFTGDFVETLVTRNVGLIGKIYAFEPGEQQYSAMQSRVKRIVLENCLNERQIELINGCVGEEKGFCSLTDQAGSSSLSVDTLSGGDTEVFAIDDFFKNSRVTLIKADIEGMELAMLKGAQNLIQTQKPRLAVCIYHKPQDFYEIPEYIHSLVPEYHMAVRHHSQTFAETVLYCWID